MAFDLVNMKSGRETIINSSIHSIFVRDLIDLKLGIHWQSFSFGI